MQYKSEQDEMPDWPPQVSASGLPENETRYGSTGQLFQVRSGRWVRVRGLKVMSSVPNGEH